MAGGRERLVSSIFPFCPVYRSSGISAPHRRGVFGTLLNTDVGNLADSRADDDSNNITLTTTSSEKISAQTTWTLLLYLTSSAEGCIGGETVFYTNDRPSSKEAIPVAPETGMLLLHKHGDDCMLVSSPAAFLSLRCISHPCCLTLLFSSSLLFSSVPLCRPVDTRFSSARNYPSPHRFFRLRYVPGLR